MTSSRDFGPCATEECTVHLLANSARVESCEVVIGLEQLLRECDLEKKLHSNAATLSGGQKRKLQLAIGLLGGSRSMLLSFSISYRAH